MSLQVYDMAQRLLQIFQSHHNNITAALSSLSSLLCPNPLSLQVYDMAQRLLQTCQAQQGPWQGAWPGELAHAAVTLAELQPARIRWLWQAGEVRLLQQKLLGHMPN
jgi:hypothetical protein